MACRARLAEDRLAEVLAAYRKLRTDNESYRERVLRDAERQSDRRRERLVIRFIEILDNLDRALEAAEQTYAGNPLVEGLILVRTQLLQALQREGLERIPVLGLAFEPAFSEAVGTQPVSDPDHHNVVTRELLRGYRLHGKVARPSRVIVGRYGEEVPAEPPPEGELIGADEVASGAAADADVDDTALADPAAGTIPLDEHTLREIFGDEFKK
jgi:molecular chaperone GrpE